MYYLLLKYLLVSFGLSLYLKAIMWHFSTHTEYSTHHLHALSCLLPTHPRKRPLSRAFPWREESGSDPGSPCASCLALGNLLNFSETLTYHLPDLSWEEGACQSQGGCPNLRHLSQGSCYLPVTPSEPSHWGHSSDFENGSFFAGLHYIKCE